MGQSDLASERPWLRISQEPGAEIALNVFRHSVNGRLEAMACTLLIQAILFAALALASICVYCLSSLNQR